MSRTPERGDYLHAMSVLEGGRVESLEDLALLLEGLPDGRDPLLHGHWIGHAIDGGARASIDWMLAKGVDLAYRDEDGYGAVHSALERRFDDRLEVLERLVLAGAPLDMRGVNDWTPAHMAAARDDVDALRVLVRLGADLALRTRIDHYATPLEEARHLGRGEAVRYLEGVERGDPGC